MRSLSKPLADSSTLDRLPGGPIRSWSGRPTWRSFGARASAVPDQFAGKSQRILQRICPCRSAEGLSLSGGASIQCFDFFKLSIILLVVAVYAFGNNKGDPLGR